MLALEDLDCITDQLRVLAWHFLDFGMGFSDTLATDGAGHIMLATFSFLLGHFSFFFFFLCDLGAFLPASRCQPCIYVAISGDLRMQHAPFSNVTTGDRVVF